MRLSLGCILALALGVLPPSTAAAGGTNNSPSDAKATSDSETLAGPTGTPNASAVPAKTSLDLEIEDSANNCTHKASSLGSSSKECKPSKNG